MTTFSKHRYTPDAMADELVRIASIEPGDRVLEPSAGRGAIVRAIHRVLGPRYPITVCEKNTANILVLERLVGPSHVLGNFLFHTELYDRIVMNPPHANGQAADHIRHAHFLLAPGGRLVALVYPEVLAEGTSFLKWLKVGWDHKIINIEPGMFEMDVSCRIIVIRK